MADETRDSQELPIFNIRKRNLTPLRKTAGDYYGFMNSPISSYEESFKLVLQGKTIADLIRTRPAPIVIDLMAPPGTVHDLLSEFPNGRGLAVSLPDHRVEEVFENVAESYKAENVKWLPEDITHPGTWDDIEKWLGDNKAHLIMERGMAGLAAIPARKKLFQALLNRAWSLLDPNGGILLFETPRRDVLLERGIRLVSWVNSLREVVDTKYWPGNIRDYDPMEEGGKIMLTRAPSSPPSLPSI